MWRIAETYTFWTLAFTSACVFLGFLIAGLLDGKRLRHWSFWLVLLLTVILTLIVTYKQ